MTKLRDDVNKKQGEYARQRINHPKRQIQSIKDAKVDGRFKKVLELHNIDPKKLIERDVLEIDQDVDLRKKVDGRSSTDEQGDSNIEFDDDSFLSEYSLGRSYDLGVLNNRSLEEELKDCAIGDGSDLEEEIWDTIEFVGLSDEKEQIRNTKKDVTKSKYVESKQHNDGTKISGNEKKIDSEEIKNSIKDNLNRECDVESITKENGELSGENGTLTGVNNELIKTNEFSTNGKLLESNEYNENDIQCNNNTNNLMEVNNDEDISIINGGKDSDQDQDSELDDNAGTENSNIDEVTESGSNYDPDSEWSVKEDESPLKDKRKKDRSKSTEERIAQENRRKHSSDYTDSDDVIKDDEREVERARPLYSGRKPINNKEASGKEAGNEPEQAVVPRRTGFWDHDDRFEDVVIEESIRRKGGRKPREKANVDKWKHDCYKETEQGPKEEVEEEPHIKQEEGTKRNRNSQRRKVANLGDFIPSVYIEDSQHSNQITKTKDKRVDGKAQKQYQNDNKEDLQNNRNYNQNSESLRSSLSSSSDRVQDIERNFQNSPNSNAIDKKDQINHEIAITKNGIQVEIKNEVLQPHEKQGKQKQIQQQGEEKQRQHQQPQQPQQQIQEEQQQRQEKYNEKRYEQQYYADGDNQEQQNHPNQKNHQRYFSHQQKQLQQQEEPRQQQQNYQLQQQYKKQQTQQQRSPQHDPQHQQQQQQQHHHIQQSKQLNGYVSEMSQDVRLKGNNVENFQQFKSDNFERNSRQQRIDNMGPRLQEQAREKMRNEKQNKHQKYERQFYNKKGSESAGMPYNKKETFEGVRDKPKRYSTQRQRLGDSSVQRPPGEYEQAHCQYQNDFTSDPHPGNFDPHKNDRIELLEQEVQKLQERLYHQRINERNGIPQNYPAAPHPQAETNLYQIPAHRKKMGHDKSHGSYANGTQIYLTGPNMGNIQHPTQQMQQVETIGSHVNIKRLRPNAIPIKPPPDSDKR